MSGRTLHTARVVLTLLALGGAGPAIRAQDASMPAAGPAEPSACGTQAARYEDGKGFRLAVTRAGEVRIENPLRPLTPEVNHVLQVVIAGNVATAYGPDFAALRRGGAPAAVEATLGAPIRWQAALPLLPDPIAIVTDDGAPLAELSFRACEEKPALKAVPQARIRAPAKGPARDAATDTAKAPKRETAKKTPSGFSIPQGAIDE